MSSPKSRQLLGQITSSEKSDTLQENEEQSDNNYNSCHSVHDADASAHK